MSWVSYPEELVSESKLKGETNDCTVIAWSMCFDAPYSHSHFWMNKHGRVKRRGMRLHQIMAAIDNCKKAKIRKGPYTKKNRISISTFCKKHPVGRYYVLVSGHALCIKDGVVHDWKHGPRRLVSFAARVYLEGEI